MFLQILFQPIIKFSLSNNWYTSYVHRTERACLDACPRGVDVCTLPLNPPPTNPSQCQQGLRRWGFQNGECKLFYFSGCEKNGNHFR